MEQKMEESEVQNEYQRSKAGGKQPLCPYCNEPLEVGQFYTVYVQWSWNDKERAYHKENPDWQEEKPFCTNCEAQDWDFIDHDMGSFMR